MARPTQLRKVSKQPLIHGFKPMGVPMTELEALSLQLDELEALRLADREGLYQEEAAERMGVSRVTFGRILQRARAKVAEALLEGKALVIGEGPVRFGPRPDGSCPVHGGPRRRGRACRCDPAADEDSKGGMK
jgi:predicted DNA-binding protein (UPF0251 family)